ncbi:hypothetical protein CERSUDRAFT_119153 [Gelatoporia subvermispora B]|uniref:Mob1/phocein n=1 Tax=Ceriporiopsis subvermispora (strain B) TaxID=914234 RepID=M2Q4Z3_CERS8|nr:hypothetical protein CERSUDRAFT_119153 [Gelatoporia subvermispora B]
MAATIQRPLRGSRISSFYPVKSLPPISALDSAFQLQEYISLLIRLDVHDVDAIVSIPGKSSSKEQDASEDVKAEVKDAEKEAEILAEKDAKNEVVVDKNCWIYEQLRRLAQDLSYPLITMLQQECSRATCPDMKAGEWQYLCVAHGTDGAMEQCCAIDYILHTLDSATALLNSPRAFPSRLSIPQASQRHFSSLARRLGRIFAHAYFHHREVFEQAEAESSLYARFLALTHKFDLVPSDFLVIPSRASHLHDDQDGDVEPPRLLGASIDPRKERERGPWLAQPEEYGRERDRSPPGPAGHERNESPRKLGRSRTDTMVFSEAVSVAEELSKADASEAEPVPPQAEETGSQVEISAGEAPDQPEASAAEALPAKPEDAHEPAEAPEAPERDIADEAADDHVVPEGAVEEIVIGEAKPDEASTLEVSPTSDEQTNSSATDTSTASDQQHNPSTTDTSAPPETVDEIEAPAPSSDSAAPTQEEFLEKSDQEQFAPEEPLSEAIVADRPSAEDSVSTDPILDATAEVEEQDIATAATLQQESTAENTSSAESPAEVTIESVSHTDADAQHAEADATSHDTPAADDGSSAAGVDAGSDA